MKPILDNFFGAVLSEVLFRVEKLGSDLYLLKDGEVETAFRSNPTDVGYELKQVGSEFMIICLDDADLRTELLTLLEEAG